MTTRRRHTIELAILIVGLIGLVFWSGLRLLNQRAAAITAAADLQRCEDLAQRIRTLENKSRLAGAQEIPMDELARPIEQAARSARIDTAQSLVRVVPESPRRIGDSSYKEAATQVQLRQITLGQLVAFLHSASSNGTGLETTSIRLSAPRDQENGEHWTVETTLSYLIYSPKSSASSERGGS